MMFEVSLPYWGEQSAPIEVENSAAQPELRHFDHVVGTLEDNRLPLPALGVNFHHEFSRIDHSRIEIVGRLAVAAQLRSISSRAFDNGSTSATS